ncbi:MAG TPA: DUF512 domain-containing protein, partial [Pyrinomonadaceae bacterium]|nr:DUF512 domain-containing protein [Pyrinomonadaceae bacterium]
GVPAEPAITRNPARGGLRASELNGTILTGEMFAPTLGEQIARFNEVHGSRLRVVAVRNEYFGGDVSVAGLLSGSDLMRVRDEIEGDFVMIPPSVIKSDEPVLIDGMQFAELEHAYPVPIIAEDLVEFLSRAI